MASPAKLDKNAIANAFLSNEGTVWVVLVVFSVGFLYFFLPGIYNGIKNASKAAFKDLGTGLGGAVDSTFSNVSSIIGPGSELPNQGLTNEVQQTIAPGGRGLSDLYDATFGKVFN